MACVGGGGGEVCPAPSAATEPASLITSSSATLNGSINPAGCATSYTFEYGPSSSPNTYPFSIGGTAGSGGFENGGFAVHVGNTAFGLQSSTSYHFRVSATSSGGTSHGVDKSFTTAPSNPPPTPKYVALGDSYSAGTGTGTFYEPACNRSTLAYPWRVSVTHPSWAFVDVACAGATTLDIIHNQVSSITAGTTLVTYTAGGNDAEFSNVLKTCINPIGSCEQAMNEAQSIIINTLPQRLELLNNQIKLRAPNARVLVLDYPRIFNETVCTGAPLLVARQKRLNELAVLLGEALRAMANSAGSHFTPVDVIPRFKGHAVCDGGSGSSTEWINGISSPQSESFHPKATGHDEGYYFMVQAAIGS